MTPSLQGLTYDAEDRKNARVLRVARILVQGDFQRAESERLIAMAEVAEEHTIEDDQLRAEMVHAIHQGKGSMIGAFGWFYPEPSERMAKVILLNDSFGN